MRKRAVYKYIFLLILILGIVIAFVQCDLVDPELNEYPDFLDKNESASTNIWLVSVTANGSSSYCSVYSIESCYIEVKVLSFKPVSNINVDLSSSYPATVNLNFNLSYVSTNNSIYTFNTSYYFSSYSNYSFTLNKITAVFSDNSSMTFVPNTYNKYMYSSTNIDTGVPVLTINVLTS